MSHNRIIDLKDVFERVNNNKYTVIKLSKDFPNYNVGDDIDIFCYDIQSFSRDVLSVLQRYISENVNVTLIDNKKQIYIDITQSDVLQFRFDLYGAIPLYRKIIIKNALFSSIIENSEVKVVKGIKVKTPSDLDEAILRYIEYQEWYSERPDKIKHIDYIQKEIDNKNISRDDLFQKIHYYTSIPVNYIDDRRVSKSYFIRNIENIRFILVKTFEYFKSKGFKKTAAKIIEKIQS